MEKLNNRPKSGTFPKPTVHPRRSSLQFSSNHNSVKVSIDHIRDCTIFEDPFPIIHDTAEIIFYFSSSGKCQK